MSSQPFLIWMVNFINKNSWLCKKKTKLAYLSCLTRLRLGDLGVMDDDGFLIVLGKLEEFITLNSGEVISPLRVRKLLRFAL